jgi:hypothetical protein
MRDKRKSFSSPEEARRFWNMVFETFQAGKLSVRQFCKKEGLAEWSFYHWRKKLRPPGSEDAVGEKIIAPAAAVPAGSPPCFTPIAQVLPECAALRIEFPSGICLAVFNGCDKQLLHETMDGLRC